MVVNQTLWRSETNVCHNMMFVLVFIAIDDEIHRTWLLFLLLLSSYAPLWQKATVLSFDALDSIDR